MLRDHSAYKKLVIESKTELDPEKLRQQLEEMGFPATKIETNQGAVTWSPAAPNRSVPAEKEPHWLKWVRQEEPGVLRTLVHGKGVAAMCIVMAVAGFLFFAIGYQWAIGPTLLCLLISAGIAYGGLLCIGCTEFNSEGWVKYSLFQTRMTPWST